MTAVCHANSNGGPAGGDAGAVVARGAANFLCLAAAPVFAIMALISGAGPMEVLCSAEHRSLLSGMGSMYVLMSVFHAAPWLKLISCPRSGVHRHPAVR